MLEPLLFGSGKHRSLKALCSPVKRCVARSAAGFDTKEEKCFFQIQFHGLKFPYRCCVIVNLDASGLKLFSVIIIVDWHVGVQSEKFSAILVPLDAVYLK